MSALPNTSTIPNIPFSEEAEAATLGAALINPASIPELASFLKPDDYFLIRHTYLWEVVLDLHERRESIDYLTVIEALRARNRLADVGGEIYIISLFRNTPTALHAEAYGRLVQRAAIRRRLMAAADEIRGIALNESVAIDAVVEGAEAALFKVTEQRIASETISMADATNHIFDLVESAANSDQSQLLGLSSGFRYLDDYLNGLQKTLLYVIGGRPGMGKSALMFTVALNAALQGASVFISSMEMTYEQVVFRFYAMLTNIPSQRLKKGALNQKEWNHFVHTIGVGGGLPIFIDDEKRLTPRKLQVKAGRVAHRFGLDLVICDGLYKMSPGKKMNNRYEEVGYLASRLKDLADKRELNVPIMVSQQLSRECEKRADKRPMLSDLRDSGEIEQEADVVLYPYRDVVYNEATEFPNQAEIIIAKQRDGETGVINLHFEKTITKFLDAARRNIDLSQL